MKHISLGGLDVCRTRTRTLNAIRVINDGTSP